MKKVTFGTINTKPEADPYHRDTGGVSKTRLSLDQYGNADIYQDYDSGSTSASVWHGRTLEWLIPGHPVDITAELPELLTLLQRVHDGHTVEWSGNNMTGWLAEDARDATDELEALLDAGLGRVEWAYMSVGDWLQHVNVDVDVSDDDELRELAKEFEPELWDYVVLDGDVYEYLVARRDEG